MVLTGCKKLALFTPVISNVILENKIGNYGKN